MKLKLTVDECLAFADEWSQGITIHEDSQGWRVVCMVLAEEVRRQRDFSSPTPVIVVSDDGLATKAKTPFGKTLLELRREYINSGGKLYTADEILAIRHNDRVQKESHE